MPSAHAHYAARVPAHHAGGIAVSPVYFGSVGGIRSAPRARSTEVPSDGYIRFSAATVLLGIVTFLLPKFIRGCWGLISSARLAPAWY
jgi:hypothetical protein